MKRLRLLGLSFVLLVCALAQAQPAFAACTGRCTSDAWCRSCTGISYAVCLGGHCAL